MSQLLWRGGGGQNLGIRADIKLQCSFIKELILKILTLLPKRDIPPHPYHLQYNPHGTLSDWTHPMQGLSCKISGRIRLINQQQKHLKRSIHRHTYTLQSFLWSIEDPCSILSKNVLECMYMNKFFLVLFKIQMHFSKSQWIIIYNEK